MSPLRLGSHLIVFDENGGHFDIIHETMALISQDVRSLTEIYSCVYDFTFMLVWVIISLFSSFESIHHPSCVTFDLSCKL